MSTFMSSLTTLTPKRGMPGGNIMKQRSVSMLIQTVAAILLTASVASTIAMILSVSIAEVNRQMEIAAIGGLLDFIATIFLTMLNVIAVSSGALYSGAKIGLYAGAAISVVYLLFCPLAGNWFTFGIRRFVLAVILAEAGAAGASFGAGGLEASNLLWFSVGGALYGGLAGLILSQPRRRQLPNAAARAAMDGPWLTPLTRASLALTIVLGAAALWFFLVSPLMTWARAVVTVTSDVAATEVILPNNAATVVEVARIDAKEVTQAIFVPDSNQLAVAASTGVVFYEMPTLNPVRTIATGASRRIALSPDGQSLATITGNSAQLWQVSDGMLLFTLTGHTGAVQDVAFSPDGRTLATAALDRSVRLWRVSSGDLLYTLNHVGHVYSLGFRADGQVLATGSDMGSTLWQPTSGVRLRIVDVIFATASGIGFSPDGITLAAAMSTGNVRLRAGNNYAVSSDLTGQQAVTTLAFSPNSQLLAYGGVDQLVHLWRVDDNVALATLNGHQGAINSMAFSPDGRLLVTTAMDGTVRLWGTETKASSPTATPIVEPTLPPTPVASPTVVATVAATVTATKHAAEASATPRATPTATQDATATLASSPAPRVQVTLAVPASLNATDTPVPSPTLTPAPTATPAPTMTPTTAPTPTPVATHTKVPTVVPTVTPTTISMPPGAIVSADVGDLAVQQVVNTGSAADIAYAADSRWIAVAARDRVLILDAQTLAEVSEITTSATSLAFSPDGETLVTANGTVATLWHREDGALVREFELHGSAIMDVAFSPDGLTVATASLDQLARLWRVSDGALLHQFSHFGSVHSLAFSPDGTALATGTTVGAVQWRVGDGARLRVLTLNPNRANRFVCSPDGQNLAAATENGNIWMWRDGGGGAWVVLKGHTNAAIDVAFSPDSQLLASAAADGTVRLWRTRDGAALRTLSGFPGAVTGVAFAPDGSTLLIATTDGTIQAWGVAGE